MTKLQRVEGQDAVDALKHGCELTLHPAQASEWSEVEESVEEVLAALRPALG